MPRRILIVALACVACNEPTDTFCETAHSATVTLTADVNGCPALDSIGPDELAALDLFISVGQCEENLPNCTTDDVTIADNYQGCVSGIQPGLCDLDAGEYQSEVLTCINGIMLNGFCGVRGNAPIDGGPEPLDDHAPAGRGSPSR